MSLFSTLDARGFKILERNVQLKTRGCGNLEEACSQVTRLLYESFQESIVLTRLFATVPFSELPPSSQEFVINLATGAQVDDLVSEKTLVLSLVGTMGEESHWDSRLNSQGHVGIPLVSSSFIDAIPMMSRLLRELGMGLDWIDSNDTTIVSRVLGSSSGVFYVGNAATEVDAMGRKIIAAQDFVSKYGVKTVFGFGGAYMNTGCILVNITFLREHLDRSMAEAFMPLINRIKVSTMDRVKEGRIFAA